MAGFKFFSDGASRGNPGVAGIGVVIYTKEGQKALEIAEYIGIKTNNVAEYQALIRGLEEAIALGATELEVFADSELMVKQMRGEYKVKNAGLQPLYQKAKLLSLQLKSFQIAYVPREQNKEADKLANLGIDRKEVVNRVNTLFDESPKAEGVEPAFKMPKTSEVLANGELITLIKVEMAKGQTITQVHTSEQISYILKGKINAKINNQDINLEKGQSITIGKNMEYTFSALENTEILSSFSPVREDIVKIV